MRLFQTLLLLTFLVGCLGSDDSKVKVDDTLGAAYLEEVVTALKENIVTKNEVNWVEFDSEIATLSSNVGSITSTYPAIKKAFELLDTNHTSLFNSDGEYLVYYSELNCEPHFYVPDNPSLPKDIGYIRVDGTLFGSDKEEYIADIQEKIKAQDSPSLKGWVIDLRKNHGGSMFPMIAALGPFFDQEVLGYFYDADNYEQAWGYQDGGAFLDTADGRKVISQVNEPYELINPYNNIAVLASRETGSAGEGSFISFLNQHNVKTFGNATCGVSSGNIVYNLSDGSYLALTTAIMADRNKNKFGKRVPVDETSAPEDALEKALEWLQQ